MVTDKEALAASTTLQRYCDERDGKCYGCFFDHKVGDPNSKMSMCILMDAPRYWDRRRLADAYKEAEIKARYTTADTKPLALRTDSVNDGGDCDETEKMSSEHWVNGTKYRFTQYKDGRVEIAKIKDLLDVLSEARL